MFESVHEKIKNGSHFLQNQLLVVIDFNPERFGHPDYDMDVEGLYTATIKALLG